MDVYGERGQLQACHHHPLSDTYGSFCCALCNRYEARKKNHYHCTTCNVSFHYFCTDKPPKIIHPYHPTHPLTFHRNWGSHQYPTDQKCSLCFQVIAPFYTGFYRCSICNFSIHNYPCTKYERPLINHLECHEHSLAFQPQQKTPFTCNVCGLTHSDMFHYECIESDCDFAVHEGCIYLSRAKKITCHKHNLSRIDSLPSGEWSCEICHGGFDHNYGAYVCNEGCSYAIHLLCATMADNWDDENPKKPVMDPVPPPIHPHALSLIPGRIKSCEVCHQTKEIDVSYFYYCQLCEVEFHRGCTESSLEIKHPFHPHPLRLGFGPPIYCQGCSHSYTADMHNHYYCDFCYVQFHAECAEAFPEIKHPFHPRHSLTFITSGSPDYSDGKCHLCGKGLKEFLYHCSICNFSVDMLCARKPPSLDINHSKSHEHRLTLLPRLMNFFTCNACGLAGDRYPYVCYRCDFMIHIDCVDRFPRVIKITRHQHRLSHTSSLSRGKWSCRFCHQEVDGKYGVYSCNYKGCAYVIHSKCATRDDVWDGKELEGKPDELKDVTSFTVRDDGVINHCSHKEHDLRVNKVGSVYDEDKRCEACTLHVLSNLFYSCVHKDCHFILHEKCANLPRKLRHILHRHQLDLYTDHMQSEDLEEYMFRCTACFRDSSGFKYKCVETGCNFQIDAKCASVLEPFDHRLHKHPLFFTLHDNKEKRCCGCGEKSDYMLNCIECDFVLDFKCATLPFTVKYRYDDHLLSLSCINGEANGQHWCEICEKEIDPNKWFYTCDECGIISHVGCMLGMGPFRLLKPGKYSDGSLDCEFEVVSNNHIPHPPCKECRRRCLNTIAIKAQGEYHCSFECLERAI